MIELQQKELSLREQNIVNMRKAGFTLQDIGDNFFVSKERIRQILVSCVGSSLTNHEPRPLKHTNSLLDSHTPRPCVHCGQIIEQPRKHQKFCVACRALYEREWRNNYRRNHREHFNEYHRNYYHSHKEQMRRNEKRYRNTEKAIRTLIRYWQGRLAKLEGLNENT